MKKFWIVWMQPRVAAMLLGTCKICMHYDICSGLHAQRHNAQQHRLHTVQMSYQYQDRHPKFNPGSSGYATYVQIGLCLAQSLIKIFHTNIFLGPYACVFSCAPHPEGYCFLLIADPR